MSQSRVLTAKLTAIYVSLIHISLKTHKDYVILTDSLCSICDMEPQKISIHSHPIMYPRFSS
jgi:hypothetical protein